MLTPVRGSSASGGLGGPFGGKEGAWPPVPGIWEGERAVILAGGPSLTGQQAEAVKGKAKVCVVNTTFRLAPWADLLYACDHKWWEEYADPKKGMGWPEFEGLKVTQDARTPEAFPEVKRVPSESWPGLSMDPLLIHQGCNGGYQALNLLALMGANPIILLGYDMKEGPNGERHHHGLHPKGLNNPDKGSFNRWLKCFDTVPPDVEKMGVTVLNATTDTALECFPRVRLEDVI